MSAPSKWVPYTFFAMHNWDFRLSLMHENFLLRKQWTTFEIFLETWNNAIFSGDSWSKSGIEYPLQTALIYLNFYILVKILFWFSCSAFILLMILSCREKDNLLGDVSGDTFVIIGLMREVSCPMVREVYPETSPTKFFCSRHDKIINNCKLCLILKLKYENTYIKMVKVCWFDLKVWGPCGLIKYTVNGHMIKCVLINLGWLREEIFYS